MRRFLLLVVIFALPALFVVHHAVEKSYFDYSKVEKARKGTRMLVIWTRGLGEEEFVHRIERTFKGMGGECYLASSRPRFWQRFFLKHPLDRAVDYLKPDLIVNVQGYRCLYPQYPNYACLSHGVWRYFGENSDFDAEKLRPFDGFLPSFSNFSPLREKIEKFGKDFHALHWFPTANATSFSPKSTYRLFYCGTVWDPKRGGKKFKKLFKYLDNAGYLDVYGPKSKWKHTPKSYRGLLPFDGKSFQEAIGRSGVSLVLHSQEHLDGAALTARIFEAAAASNVIICDNNPFVKEIFGDAVLYIDHEKSAGDMYTQIDAYMQWIRSNPVEAQRLARKAHAIFSENYTLEKQLTRLLEMHYKITGGTKL